MQRKIFPFVRGVRGGPQPPSEDQFCENILSFFTFSRGKNEFFQSCSEWCQKLKKNRLYFSAFGGGGIKNPKCRIFVIFFIFLTLYPSLTSPSGVKHFTVCFVHCLSTLPIISSANIINLSGENIPITLGMAGWLYFSYSQLLFLLWNSFTHKNSSHHCPRPR